MATSTCQYKQAQRKVWLTEPHGNGVHVCPCADLRNALLILCTQPPTFALSGLYLRPVSVRMAKSYGSK